MYEAPILSRKVYRSLPAEKGGRGAERRRSLPRDGVGIHRDLLSAVVSHAEICTPRKGWGAPVSAGVRGAKKPRSDYLGGRAEVRHLLLGGRAGKMAYKQRMQIEEMSFVDVFPA